VRTPHRWLRLALLVGVMVLAPALAWGQPGRRTEPLTLREDGSQTSVTADSIQQLSGGSVLVATGNVEIVRGPTRLLADRVELNRDTGDAAAQGRVVFYDGDDRLVGERVDYNLRTGTGVVHHGSAFAAPYYSVSGERMDRLGDGIYQIRDGVFTTCEGDEPVWSFRLGSATADLNDSIFGRDASFWVKSVPVWPWLPFFAAAIRRERQSGFLFPTFGASSHKGAFAQIPYFWAIDDSQDLTVSADVFTSRGFGASAEYRYILSEKARGSINGFGIHEVLRDRDTRGFLSAVHQWLVAPRASVKLDINVTSDDRIFRDYADRLHQRTQQRAESNAFVSYRWDTWNLVGNVLWYQDLTTRRPVELQRVPDIKLQGLRQPVPGVPGLLYEVESSATYFVRQVGPEGPRVDLHPRMFYPISLGGIVTATPFAGGRLTYYDERVTGSRITRVGGLSVEESEQDRHVRSQVELGMELDSRASRVYLMDGTAGLSALQHVIEPRAVWREIRGVDQKGNPTFDGIDRIGKVSEVTYSLTNRLNGKTVAGPDRDPVRWEMMRLVLSQTVKLLPAADERLKDLNADLLVRPNDMFAFRTDGAWNPHGLGLRRGNAEASITWKDVSAAVATRFNEIGSGFHTVRGTVGATLTRNLAARASSEWDVFAGVPVEQRFGVDLHYQCWAAMLEYISRHRNEDEFRFSVNLLGVGQLGGRTGTGFR